MKPPAYPSAEGAAREPAVPWPLTGVCPVSEAGFNQRRTGGLGVQGEPLIIDPATLLSY